MEYARLDTVSFGKFAISLHGSVKRGAGLAIRDDGKAAGRKLVPDFFQSGERGPVESDIDQAKRDRPIKFMAFHIRFYAECVLAMVTPQCVFQPFDAVAAEPTQVAGTLATLLHLKGTIFRRETVKSVQTVVLLIDVGGLQMLIEE